MLHVESGSEYSDVPVLAIQKKDGRSVVLAGGSEAVGKRGFPDILVSSGFEHPRTLLADFALAEQTLKYFLRKLRPNSFFALSPVVLIHPQAFLEGGLTQLEIRAFVELGRCIGGQKVFVWQGPELTKGELRERRFSRAGGKLLYP